MVVDVNGLKNAALSYDCDNDDIRVKFGDWMENPETGEKNMGYAYIYCPADAERVIVNIYVHETPSICVEIAVTVSADGAETCIGNEKFPDFGAMTGVAPSRLNHRRDSAIPVCCYFVTHINETGYANVPFDEYVKLLKKYGYKSESQEDALANRTKQLYVNDTDGTTIKYYKCLYKLRKNNP